MEAEVMAVAVVTAPVVGLIWNIEFDPIPSEYVIVLAGSALTRTLPACAVITSVFTAIVSRIGAKYCVASKLGPQSTAFVYEYDQAERVLAGLQIWHLLLGLTEPDA